MSRDGFIKRWSRRKQGADVRDPSESPAKAPPVPPLPTANPAPASAAPPTEAEADFDPSSLPPIESLGADSDYTQFLRKGVPEVLRLAALRRAWMSDAFIREFRSPAIEYGWDFTTPDYSLRATDDVAKLLDGIFGSTPSPITEPGPPAAAESPSATPPVPPAEPPQAAHSELAPPPPPTWAEAAPEAAPEPVPEPAEAAPLARRRHGGALPG